MELLSEAAKQGACIALASSPASLAQRCNAETQIGQNEFSKPGSGEHLDNQTDHGMNDALIAEVDEMKRIKERVETSDGIKWATGTTRQEVEQRKREIIEEDLSKQSKKIPDFKSYATGYIALFKQRKVSENTMVGYSGYLKKHLFPAFGNIQLNMITVNAIQSFMNEEADKGYARASISKIMQLFTQVMDSAVEDGFIPWNPCKSKKLFNPSDKVEEIKPYEPHIFRQIEALLPTIEKENDRLYLALSMYTGMRQGELIALRWEDIDMSEGFIRINSAASFGGRNKPKGKAPKTDSGRRPIPILKQLKEALGNIDGKSGLILHGCKQKDNSVIMSKQAVKNMDERINKAFLSAGIPEPFFSHRMRHTIVTLLNNSRLADDKSLQTWAGHSDSAFTRRQYMTSQEEQLKAVSVEFSKYLSAPM